MAQIFRKTVLGVALLLSCVACTSGGGDGKTHESSVDQFPRLNQLKSVDASEAQNIAADEFPSDPHVPKVIGEVRKGPYRLIAYIQGDSCGLRVTDASDPKRALLHVTSAWPANDSDGSAKYPAGPYSFASAGGASGSDTWASLGCGKSAMVIGYSSRTYGPVSDQRGDVSVKKNSEDPVALMVVIGPRGVREKILPRL
ncbi:hypothetical protein [Streptomyces sp. AM6-12]|uniref:hypothetical protein n=1 Tax=Streptomyces sp. AM6-12 TaxID=3345149 RepID=UPI003799CBB5